LVSVSRLKDKKAKRMNIREGQNENYNMACVVILLRSAGNIYPHSLSDLMASPSAVQTGGNCSRRRVRSARRIVKTAR